MTAKCTNACLEPSKMNLKDHQVRIITGAHLQSEKRISIIAEYRSRTTPYSVIHNSHLRHIYSYIIFNSAHPGQIQICVISYLVDNCLQVIHIWNYAKMPIIPTSSVSKKLEYWFWNLTYIIISNHVMENHNSVRIIIAARQYLSWGTLGSQTTLFVH